MSILVTGCAGFIGFNLCEHYLKLHSDLKKIYGIDNLNSYYDVNLKKNRIKILKKYYGETNFNDGRKKMSKMPKGSSLIYNPSSAAPGFKIKNVFCLPGVPLILKSMIHNCSKYLNKGSKVFSDSINLITVESNISKELTKVQKKFKKDIDIGSYPFFRLGRVGVSIVLRSQNKHKISLCKKEILKNIVKKKKIRNI